MDQQALHGLARHVAVHISTGPGMQAVAHSGFPPTLWQPLFCVCVGSGQIRVMTFAFVGEPVTGDRPDSKRTPWILRLTTGDLAVAAKVTSTSGLGPATAPVSHVTEPASDGAQFIINHIVSLEDELFAAIDTGDWNGLLGRAETQQPPLEPVVPHERVANRPPARPPPDHLFQGGVSGWAGI